MKKTLGSILLISLSLSTTFANATSKTVLHVPLFVEVTKGAQPNQTYEYVAVAEFNKVLVQRGQNAQTEFVDLSKDTQFDFFATRDSLDTAIQAAGVNDVQALGEYVPAAWGDEKNYTCYRGNGSDVIEIVLNNVDSLYSDQYTLLAWKLGKTINYTNVENETQFDSKVWNSYDKNSDTVLMLASVGDDGTDVNESVIPRCK